MKTRKIAIITGGALVLIVAVVAIILGVLNNHSNDNTESWTNLSELSDEFMEKYFAEYEEMRENSDPDNILIVTSRTRPADYGAERVVEAPNYIYFLQYATAEEKDAAYAALIQDDNVSVDTNDQIIELEQDDPAISTPVPIATNHTHMSWGVSAMGLDTAIDKVAELGKGTEEVKVAVIDTGIAQDIFEHYYQNRLAAVACVSAGEDTCKNFNGTLTDLNGHGSHVAGIIADGTPDNVHIVAILAYTATGRGTKEKPSTFIPSDLITAVNRAHEEGADVINMSLGWHDVSENNTNKYPTLERTIDAVVEEGTVVVASSGNNGGTEPHYPSGYDSVISVGALVALPQNCSWAARCSWATANNHTYADYQQNDYMLTHMSLSSHNSTVEFAAPGSGIASLNYQNQDDPAYKSGTSMAAPHVAAAVAVLKSFNSDVDVAGARRLLSALTTDLTEVGSVTTTVSDDNIVTGETVEMITGLTGRDEYYGFGVIDFNNAKFCVTEQCEDYGILVASSLPAPSDDNPSGNQDNQPSDTGGYIGSDDGTLENLSRQQYVRTCFEDVAPDGFYAGAIKWGYYDRYGDYGDAYPGYNGRITQGTTKCENGHGGQFGAKEQDIVLRRDALVMLWRLAGEPDLNARSYLKDDKAYDSYADYAEQAIDYLCQIASKGSDCANTRNSKEAMTAIGWAANLITTDKNGNSEALVTGIEGRAIVNGEEKSVIYYDMEGELSRPQVIVFLYRFYNYFYDEGEDVWMLPTEPVTKWSD